MFHPREEILARLRSTIVGWKAEVQASHEALSGQIATANNQLSRLLEVLSARNEIETLRGLSAPRSLPVREGGQASMEEVRQDVLATFERLSGVVGRWTSEVTGAQHGLMLQIDKANAQFDALLSILQTGAEALASPEAVFALEERVRQQESELGYLRQENVALLSEAKRFGDRADHLRQAVEERMAKAEAVRLRCAELEAEIESLRQAFQTREAFIQEEDPLAGEAQAAYVREAEEALARAAAAEEARAQLESELAALRVALDTAQQALSESLETTAAVESAMPPGPQEEPVSLEREAVEREWRERVEKSEAEAAEWRAEAEDARSALDLSEKHAAALKDRQIQFEGQYREVSEQASGLEQALNSARTRLSASEQRAAQLEEELPGLRLAAEQLRTLEEQHEKDRNQAADELASLESGKQDLAAQLSEAQAALDARGENENRMRVECESLQSAKQDLAAQLSEARAALESREEDGIRARGDCESLRGEKQSLERQLSETRDALAGQEEAGHRFHAERESLLETKQGLETQLSEARSALDDLRQMEHGLRGDHESLEGEKCAIEERLAKTQAALEERERRLSDRESNIDALQNYVSELEGQAEQLRDRVQESVSAVDELRGTLDAMVATDLSRVAEIEANQRAIDGLKRDLVEHAGVVDLLTKRRSELEEAVAAFTSREEAARARLRRIEEQFERNSAEVRAKEDLIAELERNLSETRAAAQAEKERLEEKLSETMGTMDALLNVSAPEAAPSSGRIFVGSAGMGTDSASEAARLEAEKQCQRIVISERAHDGEAGRKLGRILADAGALTSTQVETALREQARSGELLGAVLARLEWASEEAIAQALSCQLGLPVILPKEEVVDADAAALFHRDVCLWHVFVPLRISGGKIVMAMANPLDESACKKAADLSRKEVAPVLATSSSIMAAIDDIYGIL